RVVANHGASSRRYCVRSRGMAGSVVVCALVVDSKDPSRVAAFWKRMLGGRVVSYPQLGVEALRAPGITFDFVMNSDPKIAKNRWHLDLATNDPTAAIDAAIAAGA